MGGRELWFPPFNTMEKIDKTIYNQLTSLSKEKLFDILTKAGIVFPDTKREELTKEEMLLVADEADMDVVKKELNSSLL